MATTTTPKPVTAANKVYRHNGRDVLVTDWSSAGEVELAKVYYLDGRRDGFSSPTDWVFADDLVEVS